jgi:hypothetical protein
VKLNSNIAMISNISAFSPTHTPKRVCRPVHNLNRPARGRVTVLTKRSGMLAGTPRYLMTIAWHVRLRKPKFFGTHKMRDFSLRLRLALRFLA